MRGFSSPSTGRFLSFDPIGGNRQIPQSWNRYAYVLGNPLILIDPTGELWVASGNASNPYSWVDKCGKNQTCYETVAAVVGTDVQIYGSKNASDVTSYSANADGYVDLNAVSSHADAAFSVKSGSPSFLSPQSAAGFFNTAADYASRFPGSAGLFVTQAGEADGARRGQSKTHNFGRSVDLRYQDAAGRNIQGRRAANAADINRMSYLVGRAVSYGFDQNYSSRPTEFGTRFALYHENHLHIGKSIGNLP